MGRRAKIKEIQQAERVLVLHRTRCRALAVRPRGFLHRHRVALILGGGVTMGLFLGHPVGRTLLSVAGSLSAGLVRFQPKLLAYLFKEP